MAIFFGATGTNSTSYRFSVTLTHNLITLSEGHRVLREVDTSGRGGVFKDAWNLLRVVWGRYYVAVFFNPMFTDTFPLVGGEPRFIHSLLNVSVTHATEGVSTGVRVLAQGKPRRGDGVIVALDYISVLPLDVL